MIRRFQKLRLTVFRVISSASKDARGLGTSGRLVCDLHSVLRSQLGRQGLLHRFFILISLGSDEESSFYALLTPLSRYNGDGRWQPAI